MTHKHEYNVNSIVRAFSLLETFSATHGEFSIQELQKKTSLPASTIHRLLATMEHIGYICQNPENGKYRLGLKVFILGSRVKFTSELKMIAAPILKRLSEKYNETIHLATELDGNVLCIDKIETQQRHITVTPQSGESASLHCTSVGKCLLAFADEEHRRKLLNNIEYIKYTPYTITDKTVLEQQLNQIRAVGYSVDRQELEEGLICFGAPVFDHQGNCVAAVSLSMLLARMSRTEEDIITDIKACANEISKLLGNFL